MLYYFFSNKRKINIFFPASAGAFFLLTILLEKEARQQYIVGQIRGHQ